MDHTKVTGEVAEAAGGASNISAVAYCVTRLRLVTVDESKTNQQTLGDNEDLKGTFAAGGMFQITVSPGDVDQIYAKMVANHGVCEVSKDEAKGEAEKGGNLFSRFIKMITGIFIPILPALVAGGPTMAINNVITAEGLFSEQSLAQMHPGIADYAALINMVSSAAFVLPLALIGSPAAKRFGGNVYLGVMIGTAMVSSDLLNTRNTGAMFAGEAPIEYWHIFGMDVAEIGYQAQVIPIPAVAYVMCLIEKSLHKVLKGTTDLLLTPLITMLVTGFLAFMIIGPVTRMVAEYPIWGVSWTYLTLGVFGDLLLGLAYSPIVVTGLHQSFPVIEISLPPVSGGVGGFTFPVASVVNVAQGMAVLVIPFKIRDTKFKGLAGAGGASAVSSIIEPVIFGANLRLCWPFFCVMAAAAIGSAGVALLNVRGQALGVVGFVGFVPIIPKSIPTYLALEVLIFALSFGSTFAYAMTRGKVDTEGRAPVAKVAVPVAAVVATPAVPAPVAAPVAIPVPSLSDEALADLSVAPPLASTVVPLEQVKDELFAKGMLGPDIGIEPADGFVVTPLDGTVIVASPTGHAYGLKSASSVQAPIHVGMDTVKLDGKGFMPRVAKGDVACRGDAPAKVGLDVIREVDHDIITPVVVMNKKKLGVVTPVASGEIQHGNALLEVAPKEV